MDKLKAMTTFVRIVDAGSLTAAATSLNQSTASVVRALAALEAHLGARLLNRSTRRLALTEEGEEYLTWSRRMLCEFDLIEHRFDARQTDPAGVLRLTAPMEFGHRYVAPLVNEFLQAHPHVRIELFLLDRVVDLLEEGWDLAVRIGNLPDSSMTAMALGATRSVVCASANLVDLSGVLAHPQTLSGRPCIAVGPQATHWDFLDNGRPLRVEVMPRLMVNQIQTARLACIQGLGIARLLHYQVAESLEDGSLVRLLQEFEMPDVPIQMVYPHSRLLSPRVRRFMDWVGPELRKLIPKP